MENTPINLIESIVIWKTLWRPRNLQNLAKQSHGGALMKMSAVPGHDYWRKKYWPFVVIGDHERGDIECWCV